jgi:hypothetical protein
MWAMLVPVRLAAFMLFLFIIGQASDLRGEELRGRWGFGVGGGVASLNARDARNGDTGPLVSADLFYAINNVIVIGLDAEWEEFQVIDPLTGADFSDPSIHFTPYAEFHVTGLSHLSPYISLGLLRIGPGFDYFLFSHLALSSEFGWDRSERCNDVFVNGGTITGCTPTIFEYAVWGLRYYF